MSSKLGIFTNKYANAPLFASRQKKIKELFEKDVFKFVTTKYVVMSEKILSNIKGFNSDLYDDIKDLCIYKVRKKSCPVIHAYNNEKINIVLGHSL